MEDRSTYVVLVVKDVGETVHSEHKELEDAIKAAETILTSTSIKKARIAHVLINMSL